MTSTTIPPLTAVALGCDSFGYGLKLPLLRALKGLGLATLDAGAHSDEPDNALCDYADAVCQAVLTGKAQRGVLICGTGAAMVIRANRWPGIRAMLCRSAGEAAEARNNADMNVMVLQGFHQNAKTAEKLLGEFLTTPFEATERRLYRLARYDAPATPGEGGPTP